MAENKGFMESSMWIRSLGEFKKLRVVTFCGMMCAAAMALNLVASVSLGPYIRIGFSGLFGAALDIIKYLIKPEGAFFPGFTVSAALGGIIYGAFLYRRKLAIARVFAAQLTVKVFVNLLLNTLWLNMLYGKGFNPDTNPYSFPVGGSVDQIFAKYGFKRGIYWRSGYKDYMHYSFLGT